MRAKQIYEFTRNSDPLDTLGIGYVAKIHKFFDDLGRNRDDYTIEGKQIIFKKDLYLVNFSRLVKLPDNLTIRNDLSVRGCKNLVELPNNLTINGYLVLCYCNNIFKLPDDIIIKGDIWVDGSQTELIKWLKSSKFDSQIRYN